jgi:hypothetical protein
MDADNNSMAYGNSEVKLRNGLAQNTRLPSSIHFSFERCLARGSVFLSLHGPEGDGILTIRKGRVVVHQQTNVAGAFYIGPNSPETDAKNTATINPGTDINGNRIPDLIVTEWTGGAHCCYTAHMFELGAAFTKIGEIPERDGGVLFRDLDEDGVYKAVVQDGGREVVLRCYTFVSVLDILSTGMRASTWLCSALFQTNGEWGTNSFIACIDGQFRRPEPAIPSAFWDLPAKAGGWATV